ncbi:hypothetical protein SD71_14060 [Cohnella kolymensis]|uniref:Pesticidal crystal protein Cry22Aa Ig-like domain-containing protein n=1 Tax=Cohnella kolymensis TaxID=1590652 RepID=A0ABR5A336_9BACL|nr:hypothetical protein [Cohnella kolymensis]KIL35420.1 hypothetical protein SD71_14060 [Cohnella kolymensis]
MKKGFALLLAITLIMGVFTVSASAATQARGAEFYDHSLIELVAGNTQIGAVRVSNDDSNLIIRTYLWSNLTKMVEYHLAVGNDVSRFPIHPGDTPQNGQLAVSKYFTSNTLETTDQLSYENLDPNLTVLTVHAVIQNANGELVNAWGRGVPLTGSNWEGYFEYVKRFPTADTTPPQAVISVDQPVLTTPNHRMVPIHVTINASDDSGKEVAVQLKSINSNEPDRGLGFFDQPNDIQEAQFGTNDTAFNLRAESSIKGQGRVYTITYSLTDAAGNTSDVSTTVKVPAIDLVQLRERLRDEAVRICELLRKYGFFGKVNVELKIEQYINNYIQNKIYATYGE